MECTAQHIPIDSNGKLAEGLSLVDGALVFPALCLH